MCMKILKKSFRFLLAGCTAILFLTLFCAVYYRWPVHLPNPNQNTDYIWQPGFHWMLMSEGISWGKIDDAGFNNLQVMDDPNVLILGSSHMEAKNVRQDQNTAYLLQQKLGPDYRVYNMGISGHFFSKICQYLPQNLQLYDTPPRYVILETTDLELTQADVDQILNHTVEFTPSYTEGLIAALQKNYFFRQAVYCIQHGWLDQLMPPKSDPSAVPAAAHLSDPSESSSAPYDRLFSYMDDLQKQYDTRLIIVYHPYSSNQQDGTVVMDPSSFTQVFSDSCQKHHIQFVDMTDAFSVMANQEHKLAHGFITGTPGQGHLNKYGHSAIAEALSKTILELEEENTLCK